MKKDQTPRQLIDALQAERVPFRDLKPVLIRKLENLEYLVARVGELEKELDRLSEALATSEEKNRKEEANE